MRLVRRLIRLLRHLARRPARPTHPRPWEPPATGTVHFGGESFEPELDEVRLADQLARVRNLMADGQWRTPVAILEAVGQGSEQTAAITARLRDIRKPRFGEHLVERRRVGNTGLFEYRVMPSGTPPTPSAQLSLFPADDTPEGDSDANE
jgi:hypothetical protein